MNWQERYFDPDPQTRKLGVELYESARELPLICPHGHVDAAIFADPDYHFANPIELLIKPDHYIYRMLQSQGIAPSRLGVPRVDGGESEKDPHKVLKLFIDNLYLFRGTPVGLWSESGRKDIFGIEESLDEDSAQRFFDRIQEQLESPEFQPRALYRRFNIEVLCTTDPAASNLEAHKKIHGSGWNGRILPTFRPDMLFDLDQKSWKENLKDLEQASGILIKDFKSFVSMLENRREYFKSNGAVAIDIACRTPDAAPMTTAQAEQLFQRGMKGSVSENDARIFKAGMVFEMARMSCLDGLVMQLHTGAFRDHDALTLTEYGRDAGGDIPIPVEFARPLKPLLDAFGDHPNFTLILFTLDESTYTRELGPLAGHYPAVKIGPPWWFHDSWQGMRRFLDSMIESAGIYNTAGYNDDTRAFLSIPTRHDMWRRACSDWLAGLQVRQMIGKRDAEEMMRALCYDLAKKAYKLG